MSRIPANAERASVAPRAEGRICECAVAGAASEPCVTALPDAQLASIVLTAGTLLPTFRSDIYEYSVELGVSVSEIRVAGSPLVDDSVLMLDAESVEDGEFSEPIPLELNKPRKVVVEVAAEEHRTNRYEITVRRTLVQQARLERGSGRGLGGYWSNYDEFLPHKRPGRGVHRSRGR